MAKVRFYLKDPKAKDETYIFLKYSFKGKRITHHTRESIHPKFWNSNLQRAIVSNRFNGTELNTTLRKLGDEVKDIERRFNNDNRPLSPAEFKKQINIYLGEEQAENSKTFMMFFEQFILERERTLKEGTIKAYRTSLRHIRDFCMQHRIQLDFDDINMDFYYKYLDYLYDEPNNMSANTANKHIRVLKTVLNDATERGYNKNLTFRSRGFKKPSQKTDHIYLNELELERIIRCKLDAVPHLERVRDLFIVGSYTGLRFSDFSVLKPENIKVVYDGDRPIDVICITTKKTEDTIDIPIHDKVKDVLKKYDNKLPQALSNQKMNKYLKEIGEFAGLIEVVIQARSIGGKRQDVKSRKYELITTHTARRSFATNAYKAGVSPLLIMQITGHSTESAFMRYIKVSKEENAILMSKTKFFNSSGKLKIVA